MRLRGENLIYKRVNYGVRESDYQATYGGVAMKSAILLGIVAVVAIYFANMISIGTNITSFIVPLIVAPLVAFIMVIITHRNPSIAPITSVVYAIAEGAFLGFVSLLYATLYGGEIVQMALLGTFGVLGAMLFLFSSGIIRVGSFFRKFLISALIGYLLTSLILFIVVLTTNLSLDGFYGLYLFIAAGGTILAALFLLFDFSRIQQIVEAGADKSYEWSLSLGLIVTIVWLYIELLRLIAILSRRR